MERYLTFVSFALTIVRVFLRDAIGLGRPLSEVDQFAALGAERPVRIGRIPRSRCAALRTTHDARFIRNGSHHRLQNVSSNFTSSTEVLRCVPMAEVKRILSAYLLALTSGTHS